MSKKILVVLVVLVVLAFVGITMGVIGRSGPEPTPAPTATPLQTVTPKTATPAPTATPVPTVMPTATPTPTAGGAISIQEFIANAQAGKYTKGDYLKVSGIYEDFYLDGQSANLCFIFGPDVAGIKLIVRVYIASSDAIRFGELKKGDKIVVQGEYYGPFEGGIALDSGKLVKKSF